MALAPQVADLPDFWGIAAVTGAISFAVVAASSLGDWYFTPGVFGGFASIVFWWIATGLDGWAENGGGVGNNLTALSKPDTAGSGAFGGVLSTPMEWVFASTLASLACGVLLGVLSVKLAAALGAVLYRKHRRHQSPRRNRAGSKGRRQHAVSELLGPSSEECEVGGWQRDLVVLEASEASHYLRKHRSVEAAVHRCGCLHQHLLAEPLGEKRTHRRSHGPRLDRTGRAASGRLAQVASAWVRAASSSAGHSAASRLRGPRAPAHHSPSRSPGMVAKSNEWGSSTYWSWNPRPTASGGYRRHLRAVRAQVVEAQDQLRMIPTQRNDDRRATIVRLQVIS